MIIYNMRIAGRLMADGFVLTGMEKDKKNPNYNVFIFRDSEELRARLEVYKAESK